ncbi:MAG TPA: ABC transporter ATP-binding protein [Mycobacteriales bacterium]|nr:ABC transporter ATP-binding protein [Mycobacteriales bacterium]
MSNSNSSTTDSSGVAAPKGGATIVLEDVTKQYPGQNVPAVDHLSMEISAGEIVVLVGPSGCGKTTSMKMINRLIEPTSGRILIDGVDALTLEPDEHRRHIGYVIQQIGLFPHMTIAENIALVPRMEKWNKSRIRSRVDELLDLVGLAPSEYRDRYPRQLSGGQQQRVGVVRALAVDPPVMLMDEPFGATDPITRERLQNEFLRLQRELRKTIVFVTHDFDEALKMGDRIAVLKEQSVIAQYDTPRAILADPADDYVSSFIGAGGQLKRLALMPLQDADLHAAPSGSNGQLPTVEDAGSMRDALDAMLHAGEDTAVVLDAAGSPRGSLNMSDLMAAIKAPEGHSAGGSRDAVGTGS